MSSHDNGDSAVAASGSTDAANTKNQERSDSDLESIKTRVREMEEEHQKLKEMQDEMETAMQMSPSASTSGMTLEDKQEADSRSIYVGNVDYTATADELERHFHGCGSINRVTILQDRFTGHPKGYAYVEFLESDSVETATALEGSLFKGRQIKIMAKRTNRPGLSSTNRPPRGGFRGRGGFGRGFHGGGGFRGGFRARGRPYNRRGHYGYSPY